MFQNRVNPFGEIIATTARGSWMGNRGVIHNEQKQIVRAFKHKAWIICQLEFKGRHREVMTPDRWTELFFLDEATALAAGHRPCFECRREDATKFKSCWIKGNPEYNFSMATSIKLIDDVMHKERVRHRIQKADRQRELTDIPNGTFVQINDDPYLFIEGSLHRWTPFGYKDVIKLPDAPVSTVLTPKSVVNAMKAGYVPHIRME